MTDTIRTRLDALSEAAQTASERLPECTTEATARGLKASLASQMADVLAYEQGDLSDYAGFDDVFDPTMFFAELDLLAQIAEHGALAVADCRAALASIQTEGESR